jgi:hypothetical protein
MGTTDSAETIEIDVANCMTLPQNAYFSHCLQNEPRCRHAVPLKRGTFCCHPNHREFFKLNVEPQPGNTP